METKYCWKCKKDMPFLNEEEFEEIKKVLREIKLGPEKPPKLIFNVRNVSEWMEVRKENIKVPTNAQTTEEILRPVSETFERLTGMAGVDPNVAYHHQLSNLGPDCPDCSKPLRTPRAKLCPECGWHK